MNFYRTRQCRRASNILICGKHYCSQHNPVNLEKAILSQSKKRGAKLERLFKIKLALKAHNQQIDRKV